MVAEPGFVGAGRRRLVGDLLKVYDGVVAADTPRLVCLEAPSGWGKSRLVQELYRRMAADRQLEPGYWPSSILQTLAETEVPTSAAGRGSVGAQVAARRKRIHPEVFTPAADAVPAWLWWGISAGARPNGLAIQALREDLDQLEVHRDALERRWRDQATIRQRAQRVAGGQGARELAQTAAGEAATASIGAVVAGPAGMAVPFIVWASKQTWGQLKTARERGSQLEVDARGTDRDGLSAKLARELGAFAAVGIPTVIAVEDVHEADAALIDLLVTVLNERRGPVLIVTTSWSATLDEDDRQAHRLLTDVPESSRLRLIATSHTGPGSLDELSDQDRIKLAAGLLPDTTSPAQAGLIAARFTNPLALELACALPKIRRPQDDDRLARTLEGIPRDVRGLYEHMWDQLPEELRAALCLAVLATPHSVGRLLTGRDWDSELPQTGATVLDWLAQHTPDLGDILDQQADAYGWVRHIDTWLRSCHDLEQHTIAVDAARDLLDDTDRRDYYQQLAAHIDLDADLLDTRRYAHARLLVALAAEGFVSWDGPACIAADLLIEQAALNHDTDSLNTIIAIAGAAPTTTDPAGLTRQNHHANALGTTGRTEQAIELFTGLLADQQRILGNDHPDTLATRNDLAFWLGDAGQLQEAIDRFAGLLADQQRILGNDHPDTLTTRHNLASWLGQSGRTSEAIDRFTGLLADQQRILGNDHPDTLTTRNNLAASLGDARQLQEAIDRLTELLTDQQRILGNDHPETLATRHNLASWLGDAGRTGEAIDRFTGLLADQQRILGNDHPDTLATRNNLASRLGDAGQLQEAIELLTGLLADQQRILGNDHPDTLRTRNNLASCLGEAGRTGEAIDRFTGLLTDQQRILGNDHPDTLTTRNNLAFRLGEAGRTGEAIELLTGLRADQQRILGNDHPDTLRTGNNLASWLGDAGRVGEAIDRFTGLLTDQQPLLGDDHPDTLRTRHNLASWLGKAGRTDEAIEQCTGLLADQQRILGHDHPYTLTTRNNLAHWLGQSGQVGEAIKLFTGLLADRQRILGDDHPDTLRTRKNLSFWLAESGRTGEAIEQLTGLLADQQRKLGHDAPDTLTTRHNLASLLGQAGQADVAIGQAHDLLEDCRRVLGTFHPLSVKVGRLLERLVKQREQGSQDGN